ncbi:unnamed protein product [Amoebophrya sp. A120]|nr:unnamed protein product [Amoebophrya sp. A120]|eukprot:GSA120T00013411001.1
MQQQPDKEVKNIFFVLAITNVGPRKKTPRTRPTHQMQLDEPLSTT